MTVGLLFPGEMGAELGAAARADVLWASEGRSEATARRAARAGLEDVGTIAALAERSETVLSVCPPAIAEEVAAQVSALGFGGLYVDANAVAPARMSRIEETLSGAGARVVDGAVLGSKGLHLYLAGDASDVAQVAQLFAGTRVDAIALPGGIGAASALKMAFGGWNKIGIALAAQAHALARAYGVDAALAAEGVTSERIAQAAGARVAVGTRDGGGRTHVRRAGDAGRDRPRRRRAVRPLGTPSRRRGGASASSRRPARELDEGAHTCRARRRRLAATRVIGPLPGRLDRSPEREEDRWQFGG